MRGYILKSVTNERWANGWRCTVVYRVDTNGDSQFRPEEFTVQVTGKRRFGAWFRALFSARRDAKARLR